MRKIEERMLSAIDRCFARDASPQQWALDNTRVEADRRQDGKCLALVFLHGHQIATVGYSAESGYSVSINLCGWNTPTTRSRLTAIVREFMPGALGVATKQGQVSIVARLAGNMVRINIDSDGWFAVNALLEDHNAR